MEGSRGGVRESPLVGPRAEVAWTWPHILGALTAGACTASWPQRHDGFPDAVAEEPWPHIATRMMLFLSVGSWKTQAQSHGWSRLASLRRLHILRVCLQESKSAAMVTVPPTKEPSRPLLHMWLCSVQRVMFMSLSKVSPALCGFRSSNMESLYSRNPAHCYGRIAKCGLCMFLGTKLSSVRVTMRSFEHYYLNKFPIMT